MCGGVRCGDEVCMMRWGVCMVCRGLECVCGMCEVCVCVCSACVKCVSRVCM